MTGRSGRYVCGIAVLLVVLIASPERAQAWCIWGFGQCAPSLVGEYALDGNPIAKLTITPDKITSTVGPVSFTADYVVKSVEGKNVTIEVGLPDTEGDVGCSSREGLHQDWDEARLGWRLEEDGQAVAVWDG